MSKKKTTVDNTKTVQVKLSTIEMLGAKRAKLA